MTQSNVVSFPVRNPPSGSIWVLFVLEDLRQHFVSTPDTEASAVIEDAIQKLEQILMPH